MRCDIGISYWFVFWIHALRPNSGHKQSGKGTGHYLTAEAGEMWEKWEELCLTLTRS